MLQLSNLWKILGDATADWVLDYGKGHLTIATLSDESWDLLAGTIFDLLLPYHIFCLEDKTFGRR